MSYLVSQMWMCLLLAGLLGFALGWLLKQLGFGSKLEELEASWKSRFSGVEGERDKLRADAAALTAQSKKLETDWTAKYATLTGDHDKLKLSLADWDKKYATLDADWKAKWAALEGDKKKLAADLEACGAKSAGYEKDLSAWKLKFADLEKSVGASKADHDSLTAKLTAGAAALAAAEAARIALGNDAKKLAAELEAEKAKHAAADADWKSKWSLHEKELGSWKLKFSELEKAGSASKADHDSLNAKLAAGAAALAAAEAARFALGNDAKKLQAELDEERKKHMALDADWKSRWIIIEKERNQFKSDLDAKVKHEAELTAKGHDSEHQWKLKWDKLSADNAALKGAYETATEHGKEDHDKHAAAEAHWKTRWAALEKERDGLKAQLDATGKHDAVLQGQLKDAQAKLAAADADWKGRWLIIEKERDGLKGQLDAAGKNDANLQGQLKDAQAKLVAADADWKGRWLIIEKERDGLKGQLDAAGKNDANLQGQLKDAQAKLAAADADWKGRWLIIEKERDGLKGQLDAASAKEKDWTGRISALEAELEKLRKVKPAIVGDIEDIEGIGPAYGEKLRGVGIAWIKQLLERGATKEGRDVIAASSGIAYPLILTWTNMADLLRLWAVTPDWAELLEASGVDTVKEIKHRVPANLLAKMTEVNAEKRLAPSLPSIELVTSWVEQAKALPPAITH